MIAVKERARCKLINPKLVMHKGVTAKRGLLYLDIFPPMNHMICGGRLHEPRGAAGDDGGGGEHGRGQRAERVSTCFQSA